MKKTHIVLIIVIAVIVGTFISMFTSTSTSVGFEQAFAEPGREFKVSGTLDQSQPIIYDPQVNSTLTVFYMTDKQGTTQKVLLQKAMPTGLQNSESIDLYGSVEDGEFVATEMLMKCPSKYNENNHMIETASVN
ncbi:MAG: hypothetical protein RL226_37 [Bacteroidota bacterium]